MAMTHKTKNERIDVRASTQVKLLLQETAKSCHKNVSEFLLDAGINAANHALSERRHFSIDEDQWQKFHDVLDRPVRKKIALIEPFGRTRASGLKGFYESPRKLSATDQFDEFDCGESLLNQFFSVSQSECGMTTTGHLIYMLPIKGMKL